MLFGLLDYLLDRVHALPWLLGGEHAMVIARVMGAWLGMVGLAAGVLYLLARRRLSLRGALALVLWQELLLDTPMSFAVNPGAPGELRAPLVLAIDGLGVLLGAVLLSRVSLETRWLPLRGRWLRTFLASLALLGLAGAGPWGYVLVLALATRSGGSPPSAAGLAALFAAVAGALALLAVSGGCLVTRRFRASPPPSPGVPPSESGAELQPAAG